MEKSQEELTENLQNTILTLLSLRIREASKRYLVKARG